MPYDLFISYSRRDDQQGRISQLVDRIKTDFATFAKRELLPFFDQAEIQGMQDWRQRILQGLRESRLLLACLSPTYLKSEYCEWEFVEYLKYEIGHLHGFNGVAPIYFVQVPGWDDKDFDKHCATWIAEFRRRQNFDLRLWHEQGEAALREAAVQERLGKLNRQIVQTITRGERAEKSLGNVDAHNPHFIGRTANLRMLRDNFVTPGHIGVVAAVNGIGGLGKTALAIEYAHAFADEYGGGRWQVRCAGKDDLRLALAELATPIGFEFTEDEKKNADLQFERTRRELKKLADAGEPQRCLLILDNVGKPNLLEPAQVAKLNGGDWLHVLATTRLGENELHGAHRDRSFLAIDELPPDDALALIESYQPDKCFRSEAECGAAREIVRRLGCFTLAVESAAVYLGQFANDVTCAAFLARLKKEGLEGLDTAATDENVAVRHGEKRVGATLQPTLERLGAAENLALEFAALLPPDQVPLLWLRPLVAKTFPEIERDAEPGYPDPWKNLLRRLFSLRLIQATNVLNDNCRPRIVRVHRLLQQLILRNCSATEREARQQALDELIEERASLLEKTANWSEARWEIEPLDALANKWADADRSQTAWLLSHAALGRRTSAEWPQAEFLLRRLLFIDEKIYGSDHPGTAVALNNLADILRQTNRLAEAEALFRRALTINEKSSGTEHTNVAAVLNNLALLLNETNRHAEAEPLFRRSLAINEASLGAEHPETATALNNLALLLNATNRLAEAEPLFRRALAIDERNFGADHPNVAIRLNNLAHLLRETNRQVDAEALVRRALMINQNSFGSEHPAVALLLNNLAELLRETGRSTEAEGFYRQALAIDENNFGLEHSAVARDLNNLALLLDFNNRFTEAEPLYRRALSIDEKCFGSDHPAVARDLNNLGLLLNATNRSAEAEALYRRALSIDEKSLGLDHPSVARDLSNLAFVFILNKRLQEAANTTRRAVEIMVKFSHATGHSHPQLHNAASTYAFVLHTLGLSDEQTRAALCRLAPDLVSDLIPFDVSSAKPKIGRNDPCPCGSGKKHKKCCGRVDAHH